MPKTRAAITTSIDVLRNVLKAVCKRQAAHKRGAPQWRTGGGLFGRGQVSCCYPHECYHIILKTPANVCVSHLLGLEPMKQ